MRHKDTAALREFLKGYREVDEKDVHPTDQQERLPMPPMEVRRGGEIIELPERDVSPLGAMLENRYSLRTKRRFKINLQINRIHIAIILP